MLLQSATSSFSFPSVVYQTKKKKKKDCVLVHSRKRRTTTTFVHLKVGFEDVAEIVHNKVLIAAALSAAIGQLSKPFTGVLLYRNKFDFKSIVQAGGFPSSHSSSVVAAATAIGLERGFADSIFGLTVVYAGIIMYDAQGVRREVGNHARALNKIIPKTEVYNSVSSLDIEDVIDSQPGISPSLESKNLGALLSEETTNSFVSTRGRAPLSVRSDDRLRRMSTPSGAEDESAEEKSENNGSKRATNSLKESIGHTEIEVIAGALLGFFVSLVVSTTM